VFFPQCNKKKRAEYILHIHCVVWEAQILLLLANFGKLIILIEAGNSQDHRCLFIPSFEVQLQRV
jgi:hypothetical protein